MRLDKYLAELGAGTRSQVKQMVKKGQVTVNGNLARDPAQRVAEGEDTVCLRDMPLAYVKYEYYMFHKPRGCVTARKDNVHRTVMDYFPASGKGDLSPVGRLDLDTEGLLLVTNDGALAHRLLSPARHVEKTYYARVEGTLTPEHTAAFAEGLEIGDGKPTAPARLVIAKNGQRPEVYLTITEGRFHQVKRMFQAVGCEVTYLKRVSFGGLTLDEELPPGAFRPLTEEELERIRENGVNGTDRSGDL